MKIKAYLCTTDWDTELPSFKANDVKIYMSLKVLKEERPCWNQCGVVQIEIKKIKQVVKGSC